MSEYELLKPVNINRTSDNNKKPDQMYTTSSPNLTGIPDTMKAQFEDLSGFSFDDVQVHYNSDKPAQLQALAYTQGDQVFLGPNQEKYLPHELGHVIQQKQGIVKPTDKIDNIPINTDVSLENAANDLADNAQSNYVNVLQVKPTSAENALAQKQPSGTMPVGDGMGGLHVMGRHFLPPIGWKNLTWQELFRPSKGVDGVYTIWDLLSDVDDRVFVCEKKYKPYIINEISKALGISLPWPEPPIKKAPLCSALAQYDPYDNEVRISSEFLPNKPADSVAGTIAHELTHWKQIMVVLETQNIDMDTVHSKCSESNNALIDGALDSDSSWVEFFEATHEVETCMETEKAKLTSSASGTSSVCVKADDPHRATIMAACNAALDKYHNTKPEKEANDNGKKYEDEVRNLMVVYRSKRPQKSQPAKKSARKKVSPQKSQPGDVLYDRSDKPLWPREHFPDAFPECANPDLCDETLCEEEDQILGDVRPV